MLKTKLKIGPNDHGRRMSLREYEPVDTVEGYVYELARGIITVCDVPAFPHAWLVAYLRDQLAYYKLAHPEEIYIILGSFDCKLLIGEFESERHPDLAVYKSKPRRKEDFWWHYLPDLVVEIVSRGSKKRDYVEKREEYLALGIKEYWIVDGGKREILALRRLRGKWSERLLTAGESYQSKVLPGFSLDCREVFKSEP